MAIAIFLISINLIKKKKEIICMYMSYLGTRHAECGQGLAQCLHDEPYPTKKSKRLATEKFKTI